MTKTIATVLALGGIAWAALVGYQFGMQRGAERGREQGRIAEGLSVSEMSAVFLLDAFRKEEAGDKQEANDVRNHLFCNCALTIYHALRSDTINADTKESVEHLLTTMLDYIREHPESVGFLDRMESGGDVINYHLQNMLAEYN